MFILYDERARYDEENAVVLATAENEIEATRLSAAFQETNGIWFQYKRTGSVLYDGRARRDIGQFILKG